MRRISGAATVFERSTVVLDACVLYPFHLRNVLVQAAVDRLFEARWTDEIHDEWIRNLTASTPSVTMERLIITRQLMNDVLPAATVRGYERYVAQINLPDPTDRHVVAAGIAASAAVILTWNLRDFPDEALEQYHLGARSPDAFLTELYDKAPELVVGSLANARRNLSRSRVSGSQFVTLLAGQKLVELADRIRPADV
jgi:hypothetical protein